PDCPRRTAIPRFAPTGRRFRLPSGRQGAERGGELRRDRARWPNRGSALVVVVRHANQREPLPGPHDAAGVYTTGAVPDEFDGFESLDRLTTGKPAGPQSCTVPSRGSGARREIPALRFAISGVVRVGQGSVAQTGGRAGNGDIVNQVVWLAARGAP